MVDDGLVTVADLLGVPALGLREVLAGSTAPLRWAHATELLDPRPYLRGGELVCTIGQQLTTPGACAEFAAAVAGAGAIGVCFGVGDVHDEVPGALEQACREHGLALLAADRGTPFMAVTEHLAQQRVRTALAIERVGQLMDLLADRLVAAAALLPALVDAGLGRTALVASTWPAGCHHELASALAGVAHLLGVSEDVTHCVTPADAPDVDLPALAAGLGLPHAASAPVPWRELGAAVRAARGAFAEALRAEVETAPAPAEEPVTLEALLAAQPSTVLDPFVQQLVRPLLAVDRQRGTGLVDTLRAYLATDGSLVEVARTQYLHVNSIRHRLKRIAELTGTDATTFAGAAAFRVALWAHDHGGPPLLLERRPPRASGAR